MSLPCIALAGAWEEIFQGEAKAALELLLPGYLQPWRWFGGKARQIRSIALMEVVPFPSASAVASRVFFAVAYGEGEPETYVLPLTIAVGPHAAEVRRHAPRPCSPGCSGLMPKGLLCEAWWEPPLWEAVLVAIAGERALPGDDGGAVRAAHAGLRYSVGAGRCSLAPRPAGCPADWRLGRLWAPRVLKLFRRVADGVNPDLELGRFLTERTSFPHIARVAGALEYHRDTGKPTHRWHPARLHAE